MLNTNIFAVHSMTTNKTTTYTKSDFNQIFQCIRFQHDGHGQRLRIRCVAFHLLLKSHESDYLTNLYNNVNVITFFL